jgi:hypothetical protein
MISLTALVLWMDLDGRTRDEEPLVNGAVDRGRCKVLSWRDLGELRLVDTVW